MTNFSPITLILFPEHITNTQIQPLRATGYFQRIFHGPEMLLDSAHHLWQRVGKKVDDPFKIELRAQDVKEDILAITFVEFRDRICQLVEHWKTLGGIASAGNHGAHLVLKRSNLILEILVLFF